MERARNANKSLTAKQIKVIQGYVRFLKASNSTKEAELAKIRAENKVLLEQIGSVANQQQDALITSVQKDEKDCVGANDSDDALDL